MLECGSIEKVATLHLMVLKSEWKIHVLKNSAPFKIGNMYNRNIS